MVDYTPDPVKVIEDVDALKVMIDPKRSRLLTVLRLRNAPTTAKEIAAELGIEDVRKLYYHLKLLEKHDLIRVVDTREVSGITEKFYHLTASRVRVARGLLNVGDQPKVVETLNYILEEAQRDVDRAAVQRTLITEPERNYHFMRFVARLTPDKLSDLEARLEDVLEDFLDDGEAGPDAQDYAFTALLLPYDRQQTEGDES